LSPIKLNCIPISFYRKAVYINRLLYFDDVAKSKDTLVIEKAAQFRSVCRRHLRAGRRRYAFTVVEIIIVGLVLVILATVVIPQFSRASQQSKQDALKDVLQYLRTQVAVFKAQHQDVPPGYPGGDPTANPAAAAFATQMTEYSDVNCDLSPRALPTFQYGPYLSQVPVNPVNGSNSVEMIGNNQPIPTPDGKTGWIFKPQTQEIIPNVTGKDGSGTPYSHY
jgi:type II secretory pathway pseudopilin PulG